MGVALLTLLGLSLALAGHSKAIDLCELHCVRRQVKIIRNARLPLRMRALEQRLEAQDQYITWLEERAARQEAKLAALKNCLGEIPLTRYGEELGPSGYAFRLEETESPQTLFTTALDITFKGDAVGAWALVDGCRAPTLLDGSVRQGPVPTAHFDGTRTPGSAFR